MLVPPEQLRRHSYLEKHHSTWTDADFRAEREALLARIQRMTTQHESAAYKSLLKEFVKFYLTLMKLVNRLNNARPSQLLEITREVLRESEEHLDSVRQQVKQSLLLLERGKEVKSILPGPSSCDYTTEDKSRIKESETWARRSKADAQGGGKARGPRRSRRGAAPYHRGGANRFPAPSFGRLVAQEFARLNGQQYGQQNGQQYGQQYGQQGGQQYGQQGGQQNGNNPPTCFYCGRVGHRRRECLKRIMDGNQ